MVELNDIPPPLPAATGNATTANERPSAPGAADDGPSCHNCGATPAAEATFRQNTGMLFSRAAQAFDGTYCRSCGLALGRSVANRTLWTGWWGLISFFVNIGYMLANAGTLLRIGTLEPPRDGYGTLDPGRPMLFRSGIVVLAAIVALGIGIAASSEETDSYSNSQYPSHVVTAGR